MNIQLRLDWKEMTCDKVIYVEKDSTAANGGSKSSERLSSHPDWMIIVPENEQKKGGLVDVAQNEEREQIAGASSAQIASPEGRSKHRKSSQRAPISHAGDSIFNIARVRRRYKQ